MAVEPGSPRDRGRADAYYGRRVLPNKRVGFWTTNELTPQEVAEYWAGYEEGPGMYGSKFDAP